MKVARPSSFPASDPGSDSILFATEPKISRSQAAHSPATVLLVLAILAVVVLVAVRILGSRQVTAEGPPGIVVRVNGEDLTQDELRRVQVDLLEISRLRAVEGETVPDAEQLRKIAMKNLIERHLLLREAARRKLSVTNDELDEAIAELRQRFEDLGDFGAWMQERGLSDMELFETVREDLLVARVTAALMDEVVIDEELVVASYEASKENLIIGQEVRLGIIAVDSAEKGEAILRALRDGVDFRRLAREYSVGQRSTKGGDTGWIDVTSLPQAIRDVVDGLQVGEASRPVRKYENEYLIVALAGRRPIRATTLDEARAVIERQLLRSKRNERIRNWLKDQEEKADIEEFAVAH